MKLDAQQKQPREVLDFDVSYSPPDLPLDDNIASVTVSYICISDPADVALVKGATTYTAKRMKVWLGGGTNGAKYKVTVITQTQGGRTLEDEFVLTVKEL